MLNVVLFEPEIPGNTGNIMRTCAGTNVKLHLIKPLGFSLEEKYIKRSGANYIQECNYQVYENYDEFLKHNKGVFYYLTRYGKKPHTEMDFTSNGEKKYIVFGKESSGIPKEILKDDLEHCLRIPMNNHIRALNLSNSVAIVVYEVLRQQNYPGLLFEEPFKGVDYLEK